MTKISRIERSVLVPKSKLIPNPWNPNKTNDRQQKAIAESLKTYSQILDIIVRPVQDKYQIIDGEHRYNELEDQVYVTILHGLSDADAKKLTIILNETRGSADKIELAQLLHELRDIEGDELILGLPYTETELEELIQIAEHDWDNFTSNFSESIAEETSDELETHTLKIAKTDVHLLDEVKVLIEDIQFSKDKEIALGQLFVYLARKYIDSIETIKI